MLPSRMAGAATVTRASGDGGQVLACAGPWDVAHAGALEAELAAMPLPPGEAVTLDLAGLERLDTAGAWLIYRTGKRLGAAGARVQVSGASAEQRSLLELMAANDKPVAREPHKLHGFARLVERTGRRTVHMGAKTLRFVAFVGLVAETLGRTLVKPRRLRLTSTVWQIEQVGLNALPIIGLLSFLIGIVLAYQGADQLRKFGAEIYVANLVGVSILREVGILLTAIVVAGRSGSAFTAQIGSMKIREEIDAMRTLGLDPIEVLVLPRLIALVIALPLLGFFASLMGLGGGVLMAWFALDVSPGLFIERLEQAVTLGTIAAGLVKAPVFAIMIALAGCYEGLRVEGSAESVGRLTTRAVVESIFLVIVADALFSIFFSIVGL